MIDFIVFLWAFTSFISKFLLYVQNVIDITKLKNFSDPILEQSPICIVSANTNRIFELSWCVANSNNLMQKRVVKYEVK